MMDFHLSIFPEKIGTDVCEKFIRPDYDSFIAKNNFTEIRYEHKLVSNFRLNLKCEPEIVYAFFDYNGKKCIIKQTKDNIRETGAGSTLRDTEAVTSTGNSLIMLEKIFRTDT